jgi:RNase adaptor protein for sRNA GlmZ degradation
MILPSWDLIIIKGAPGSGKTEVSKSLVKLFPKGVRIEVDTVRNMVGSVDWKNQNEHIKLLEISAKLAVEFLIADFSPVIIVDTFSGDKVQKFIKDFKLLKPDSKIKIFGLYLDNPILAMRLKNRPTGLFKNFEISKKINQDTISLKQLDEIQFDTSSLKSIELAQKIFNLIK